MDFYADLCFPRPGESFSEYKMCLTRARPEVWATFAPRGGGGAENSK